MADRFNRFDGFAVHDGWQWVLAGWIAAMVVAPALLALTRRDRIAGSARTGGAVASILAYVIAFDVAFITQEIALVLPKALVPGLHPVLFHNNHDWTGDAPIAELLQGSGALAILLLGLAALALKPRTPTLRLLVAWFAYSALIQSLAQGVVAAMIPGNDVGRALLYLGFPAPARFVVATLSVVATIALLRSVAARLAEAGVGVRTAAISLVIGTLLIVPYRVPGSIDQVVIVPVAVAIVGGAWLLWWHARLTTRMVAARASIPALAMAAVAILLIFQFALRPGIAF